MCEFKQLVVVINTPTENTPHSPRQTTDGITQT